LPVHHASYADSIICIGSNGEIVEQGTFVDLNQGNGYLQSLNLSESRDTLVDETEKIDKESSSSKDEPLDEKDAESSDVSIPDKQSQERRNTYVFYMKAAGKFSSFAYVLIAVIYAFLYVFPCKFSPCFLLLLLD
jgi:ATP-binding cassette, subfamily C (CFTR/MRP), member 1